MLPIIILLPPLSFASSILFFSHLSTAFDRTDPLSYHGTYPLCTLDNRIGFSNGSLYPSLERCSSHRFVLFDALLVFPIYGLENLSFREPGE